MELHRVFPIAILGVTAFSSADSWANVIAEAPGPS